MINYHIKGLYKTTSYKTKSKCSQFFSHWLLHKSFFFFPIKAFANFEKLIKFHWQALTVYKYGQNLKMLILAFLDHLKLGIECHPFSKSLDPPLHIIYIYIHKYIHIHFIIYIYIYIYIYMLLNHVLIIYITYGMFVSMQRYYFCVLLWFSLWSSIESYRTMTRFR